MGLKKSQGGREIEEGDGEGDTQSGIEKETGREREGESEILKGGKKREEESLRESGRDREERRRERERERERLTCGEGRGNTTLALSHCTRQGRNSST